LATSSDELGRGQEAETGRDGSVSSIADSIQQVSERAQLLIQEEIELAKAEISQKVTSLVKGSVVGIAAGVFAVFGLVMLLHGLAWLAWKLLFKGDLYFWGFLLVAGVLFISAALAGLLAYRAISAGTPPAPTMAIDEARLIKETVTSPHPEATTAMTRPPSSEGRRR